MCLVIIYKYFSSKILKFDKMIMVQGEVGGKVYTEPFSKGILSRSLIRAELDINEAYEIASLIESKIKEANIELISTDDLAEMIIGVLENFNKEVALNYINWRKVRNSKEPLIVLIGGASGVGTSSIAFEIANRLGIGNMISTDMIREVMRKIVSQDLSPVIHESSYTAYEAMRVPSPPEFDEVIAGYKTHVDTISVGVDAVIERALTEGISIVVEGVHIVPGFIRQDLLDRENVVLFTLQVSDPELHKGRFYSRSSQMWARRPLQKYLDNFQSIRKIQNYIVMQSQKYNVTVVENIDLSTTIDYMIKNITDKYGGLSNDG